MNSCKTIVGTTYVPVHRLGGVSGEMSSAVRFSHLLHREEERDEGRGRDEKKLHGRGRDGGE